MNTSGESIDLGSFSLGWGGANYLSGKLALSGVVAPGAVFVVGGPLSDTANANPRFDLALDFAPDLQNGGATADGVALFDVPVEELLAETVPLDAVLYGESNDSGLLGPQGVASAGPRRRRTGRQQHRARCGRDLARAGVPDARGAPGAGAVGLGASDREPGRARRRRQREARS